VKTEQIKLFNVELTGDQVSIVSNLLGSQDVTAGLDKISQFEVEFANSIGVDRAVAVSSGTAAIHLALILSNVLADDVVLCSTFTFAASAFPIKFLNANPIFIDSNENTWNVDPSFIKEAIDLSQKKFSKIPKAIIVADCYGQACPIESILEICRPYGIKVIQDCAESLGSLYKTKDSLWVSVGVLADYSAYSFNTNKIVTCFGGGVLVARHPSNLDRAISLATQSKTPAFHYEHREIGFNYRMSPILAAIGCSQLNNLNSRVKIKRKIFSEYVKGLSDIPHIRFMPEPNWSRSNRWLSCLLFESFSSDIEIIKVIEKLAFAGIESRRTWKPLHSQIAFTGSEIVGAGVSDRLFVKGLCLPSTTTLDASDQAKIIQALRSHFG